MTKCKKILLGCIGLYVFASLSLAQAQNAADTDALPQKVHAGQRIGEIYSQLNLTPDQKQQLEANKRQHRAIMEKARQEMRVNRQALQEELMKPQLDMAQVNQLHSNIKALMFQMEDTKLNSILAVRAILTPEQFAQFVNLMHKHKQEHSE